MNRPASDPPRRPLTVEEQNLADDLIHELRLYSEERVALVERFVLAIRRLGGETS